jgi:CHASE3 domain sensor protein
MRKDISIKQKNLLIIMILGTLIVLLISYSFYSIQQLKKSSILLNDSSKIILHNKEIIILHEQFVADLTRKFILNEPFEKKAQAHTKCILGTWLYPRIIFI